MAYSTSTPDALRDKEDGLRAVLLVPTQRDDAESLTKGRAYGACVDLCRASGYAVEQVLRDTGPRTVFERPTMRAAMSLLTRTRPDVVVIYTWDQLGRKRADRDRFTESMADLGIRIHAVHNASAPHLDWDSDDHTRPRTRQHEQQH